MNLQNGSSQTEIENMDMRRDRHVATETDIYNEGLAAGLSNKPTVAPEIYPYLSNDWQLWMGGAARGIQIWNALILANDALQHSKPLMAHYPEPVERHAAALAAVLEAIDTLNRVPA